MLLFLPLVFLLLSLLVLSLGNLQRGFRSSWPVALGGAALAWLSLLLLRLRIPLEVEAPTWWAGRGLELAARFSLNDVSWTLAFLTVSLLVSALMYQVQHAVQARWSSWVPTLAAGLATLLACFAADGLTLWLSWVVLDFVLFGSLLLMAQGPGQRLEQLQALPRHLLAGSLVLAGWLLAFYGPGLQAVLFVVAGGLRLGLWQPKSPSQAPEGLRTEQQAMLFFAPLAAGLAAFNQPAGAGSPWFLLVLFLPSLYAAVAWLRGEAPAWPLWQVGCAGLAAASAALGQPQALLAAAVLLFTGPAVLSAVQASPRLRSLLAWLGVLLLCGLPYTASQGLLSLYTAAPVAFLFLPVQAALLAGWMQFAQQPSRAQEPNEPWMVTIQRTGLTLFPILLVTFGLRLLPGLDEQWAASWPALLVAGSAGLLLVVQQQITWRPPAAVRARYRLLGEALSLSWLERLSRLGRSALRSSLALLANLLEGPAGVLWALVVLTFLVSLVINLGLGSS